MATSNWVGGNGDWGMAADWNTRQVPGKTTDAVIAKAVTVTVSKPSVAHSVTLDEAQAVLAVSATLAAAAGISVESGTLELLAHGTVDAAISLGAGGTVLAEAGSSLNLDLSTVAAASAGTGGTIGIAQGASLTVTTDNTGVLTTAQLQGELTNDGHFSNAGQLAVVVASTIDNAGGTLGVVAGTPYTIARAGDIVGGTIAVTSGTLTDDGRIDFTGGGTLSLSGGLVQGDGTIAGGALVLAGGSFDPAGQTLATVAVQGALTLGRGETLDLTGGTTVAAPAGTPAITVATGGKLVTDARTLLAGDTIAVTGGVWDATVIGAGEAVHLSAGTLAAARIAAGAVVTQTGTGGRIGAAGEAVTNDGTILADSSGGTLTVAGSVGNGGSIAVGDGDVLAVAGTLAGDGGAISVGGATLDVLSGGTLVGAVALASSGSLLVSGGGAFDVALSALAATRAGGGRLAVASGGTLAVTTDNTGLLTTAQLATDLANGGGFTNAGTLAVTVATTLTNTGATLAVGAASYTVAADGSIVGGTVDVTSGGLTVAGVLDLTGGALDESGGFVQDTGTIEAGTIAVSGGTLGDFGAVTLSAGGTLAVNGGLFGGDGTLTGGSLVLAGEALAAAGLTLAGVSEQGAITLGYGQVLHLTSGTTISGGLTVDAGATLYSDALTALAGAVVDVAGGTWIAGDIGGASVAVSAGLVEATTVGASTISVAGGTLQAGAVGAGAQIALDGSGLLLVSGSVAAGATITHAGGGGTIGAQGSATTLGGVVEAQISGGTLAMTGTVTNTGTIGIGGGDEVLLQNSIFYNASGGVITVGRGELLVPQNGSDGGPSSLTNQAGATIDVEGGGTLFDIYGLNAGTINLGAGSNVLLEATLFAGVAGSAGGSFNVDPSATVSVLDFGNETLGSFLSNQSAIRTDIGRPSFDLAVANALALSSGQDLLVSTAANQSTLLVDGSFFEPSQQPAVSIDGGNVVVGTGGVLELDDGNIYTQGSNVAQVVLTGGGVLLAAAGSTDVINGVVYNDSGAGSSGTIFVDAGANLEIASNFANGNSQQGATPATVTINTGATLTIDDANNDSAGANGVFFLEGNSSLVLENQADLRNQAVQFGGNNSVIDYKDNVVATASYALEGAFFGFAQSDQVVLPFDIGALSYNGSNGYLQVSDASGHTAGAEFYVGTGYNGALFGGVNTSTLTYGGAAPASVLTHH